jgi:hypothetical protein
MDLPRSSTDIAIAFPCQPCNGNGGFGMRKADSGSGGRPAASANFQPCTTCNGTGWKHLRPSELTPDQLRKLQRKLPTYPPGA